MKKFLFATLLIFSCTIGIQAYASSVQANSSAQSQASEEVYYEGPAWSVGNNDMIPQAGSTISIKWSSNGLWINGSKSGLSVQPVKKGTFLMRVNGRSKECTHYIMYGGERYFFARY